jgi:hypothetical protein
MLAPPGSRSSTVPSSSSGSKSSRSSKAQSSLRRSPDDLVRELQKLPENRKCADCTSRGTQCVNVTVHSFVCMACSGVLREISHKIKGIQHSSFTPEEAAALQQTNNARVNRVYLATYNPNASHQGSDGQSELTAVEIVDQEKVRRKGVVSKCGE